MNNTTIEDQYNQIIDMGISVTELYIYSLIIEDTRSIGLNAKEIEDIINKVFDCRYGSDLSIEEAVDRVLNGDNVDGDDELWYY